MPKLKDLIIRENGCEALPEICENYDLRNLWVFSGGTYTYKIAEEILKNISPYLNRNFKSPLKISEPSLNYVKKVREIIKENDVKFAVVVGGGSPCDVVKLASYQEGIEFIYLPTTLSHDGINSDRASIKGKYPYSEKAKSPLLVVVDLNVVKNSPLRNIRAGFGDGLAKCVSLSDWRLDCEINKEKCELEFNPEIEKGVAQSFNNLLNVAKYSIQHKIPLNSERILKSLAIDLYKFGEYMQQASSSRPCSGSEHLFSHALDASVPKPALHGEQVAVGTITCLNIYNEELSTKPYGISWHEMKKILQDLGLPINFNELGIIPTYLVNALGRGARKIGSKRGRFTVLDFIDINRKKAKKYLEGTSII